jgi:hypothetical protein
MGLPDGPRRQWVFDVVSHEGKPAWVLGGSFRDGYLAYRWKKGEWRETAKLPDDRYRGFMGGQVLDGVDLVAAGYAKPTRSAVSGSAGTIDGRKWRDLRVPVPQGGGSTFADVVATAPDRIWAVGSRYRKGRYQAYAVRWDGLRWTRVDPAAGRGSSALTGVAATPSGKIWAAGWREQPNGRLRPLILRRRASGWTEVRAATLPAGIAVLTDIDFRNGSNGFVTGYLIRKGDSRYEAVLQRWNGKRWQDEPLPWAQDRSIVPRAIDVAADGDIWIASTEMPSADREARGFLAHRSGGEWTLIEPDASPELHSDLRSVAATADGAIAGGILGRDRLVITTCEPASPADQPAADEADDATEATDDAEAADGPAPTEEATADETMAFAARRSSTSPGGRVADIAKPVKPEGFRIRDVTGSVGLGEVVETWRGVVADFDGDGWDDLFYSRHLDDAPRILLGGEDGFFDAPASPMTLGDTHGCTTDDVDDDGALDLYCVWGRVRGSALWRNELGLRVGHEDARLATDGNGALDPFGRGRVATFLHLDDDAYPELFIATDPIRVDAMPGPNRFFRNDGGRLVPAPELGMDTPTNGKCVWAADADRDGDDDLFVCEDKPQDGRAHGVRFYRNEDGKLRERSGAVGIEPIDDIEVATAEVTGDKRPDLIQLSSDRLRISRGTRDGFALLYETPLRNGVAFATGDVNGDGLDDLFIVRGTRGGNKPDVLLVSGAKGRRWTPVKIPYEKKGSGDDVLAIDHDKNGLTDFIVLNGRRGPGRVQMLAAYPKD